jgi:hypothetical protein
MMQLEKIRPWTPELDKGLSETFGHDYRALVEGVNGGWLEAYRLWAGQAYMVTRVERGTLTCCCYQGARVCEAMRWMRAQSVRLGLQHILFFTRRPGLARLLREFQPVAEETVYRIKVA